MTGNEVIAEAQFHWGGSGGATDTGVSSTMWLAYLNAAMQWLYRHLPNEALSSGTCATLAASLSLSSGGAAAPAALDRLMAVRNSSTLQKLPAVTPEMVTAAAGNTYLVPRIGMYSYDADTRRVEVRPTSLTVVIDYLSIPDEITNTASEITDIPLDWHSVLALCVAREAYMQEEDPDMFALLTARINEGLGRQDLPQEGQ